MRIIRTNPIALFTRITARCLVALLVPLAVVTAVAQTARSVPKPYEGVPHMSFGQTVFPLNGPWKFITGDSPLEPSTHQPLWANPGFDDSHWETVDLTPPQGSFDPNAVPEYLPGWMSRGHPGYSGYAWYRIRIRIDAAMPQKLALLGPIAFDDSFQFFVNGALIGSFGDFSSEHPTIYLPQPALFAIQNVSWDASADGTQALAFRFWLEPYNSIGNDYAGGFHDAPQLGRIDSVAAIYQTRWFREVRSKARHPVELVIFLLLAVLAISLSIFDRSDKVYYWIAGVYTFSSAITVEVMLSDLSRIFSETTYILVDDIGFPILIALWTMVWRAWFHLKRPVWLPRVVVILTLIYIASEVQDAALFSGAGSPQSARALQLLLIAVKVCFLTLLILIVVLGVRKQGREGWVVLPAVLMLGIGMFQFELAEMGVPTFWSPFGVGVNFHAIEELLLGIALVVLLLRRMLLSLRAQRELALDIKQAQEVQQVILPESRIIYPGLLVETEYRAARQVGGDFFQIIPDTVNGSLLIVAGDVTGKGLQAGMTVALLIGAIRSTAELNPDPLFILEALNRRLIGRESSQATCLALSIAADGSATLANAGHLPPYLNGTPIDMQGALPLGMIEGADFSVMHFRLAPSDKLVVISDGILEAADGNGQLFGFGRVAELLRNSIPVKALADAAQLFGQNDDISLVAVTRTA